MTEGQFYAVAGALRELVLNGGQDENVLVADDIAQRLVLPLERGERYVWELKIHNVDKRTFDAESFARLIYDHYQAQLAER